MADLGKTRPKTLDLFAGAGGLSLGLHWAGFETSYAIDHNPVAVETLEANLGHLDAKALLRDLSKYTPRDLRKDLGCTGFDDISIVAGGPPCQGFSRIGRAKLRSLKTLSGRAPADRDPRNDLYRSFLRFVSTIRPKVALMENVPGMLSYDGRNIADQISDDLEALGYQVTYSLLDAQFFGVPQSRARLFFVGVRKDLGIKFVFPITTNRAGKRLHQAVTVREAIADLPPIRNGARDWIRPYEAKGRLCEFAKKMRDGADPRTVFDHVCRQQNDQDVRAFRLLKQGGKYVDLPARFKRYRDDIFDDKYRKLQWNKPSWCLTAHLSRDCYSHIHPSQARTISVREAARLQSFPDHWYFGGNLGDKFQLVGNAVPPLLAQRLGEAIFEQVFSNRKQRQRSANRSNARKTGRSEYAHT
jgi:DNA (cytosine-5)-methyltransferase 1